MTHDNDSIKIKSQPMYKYKQQRENGSFIIIVKPATENTCADGADVAGMLNNCAA